jgi:hypothetical protein
MKITTIGLLAAGLTGPVAAFGGVLGDLVGGNSVAGEYAGTWTAPPGSDIDHIVVTTGSGPVRIQVFGRCETRVCNWGALPARVRTDGPNSEVVRSLGADFNLGFALRHITLHRQAGNALRFDLVTEFTDGSERHDYETAGQLVPAGTVVASAPAAAAPTAAPAAAPNAAPAPAAAAPAPQAAPAAAPKAGSGITALNPLNWFSKPETPASVQPGPEDSSTPAAVGVAAPVDDCFAIDTSHAYVVNANGNWNVRDFLHVVQGFGPYRVAAEKGLKTIGYYHFDEVCHIGRGATNMTFFRAAGEVPHQAMPGESCVDTHPDKVMAVKRDDDWKVVDGDREIFNYGSDQAGAAQAAAVIKALALSRQCYYDRANLTASYWLSR